MFIRLFAGEARLLMLLGVVVAAGGCARPPQQALPEEPEAVSSPLATPFPGSGGVSDPARARKALKRRKRQRLAPAGSETLPKRWRRRRE
jgi:hypothetical protein